MSGRKKGFTEIRYKDFILSPDEICRELFDLYRVQVNKKSKKEYEKLIGYGFKFQNALERIVKIEMSETGESMDIADYIIAYNKTAQEFKQYLQNLLNK